MQYHFPILFENIPEEIHRWGKLFAVENIQVVAKEELVNLL